MSERGVFAVDRGIWSDPDFPNEPFSEREAFLWLVSEAAWRPTKVRVGSRLIELERGQCSFSTRFMAAKFQWSEARVRRFLQRRSEMNQLCTRTDAGATQISICKYDAFQRVGTVADAPATQERRTSDAKKKQGNISSEPKGSSDNDVAREASQPSARIELAKVLDDRHAADVLDHRKRIGAPLTASAAAKLATKFAKCDDPNGAADEMLANGWRGFEPEWLERRKAGLRVIAGQQAPPQTGKDRLMETGRRMLAEERGEAEQQPWQGSTIDGFAQRRQ